VAIDSDSLERNGRWPWSRADQAQIIENISAGGAHSILVNLLYTETDERNPNDDLQLAKAIDKAKHIVLPFAIEGPSDSQSVKPPITELLYGVSDLGYTILPLDSDGLVRRVFLNGGFPDAHWSYISLAALQSTGEAPSPLPGINHDTSNQDESTWVQDHEILIPFHGPGKTFRTVSAVDVLSGDYQGSAFQDAVVFFGVTAVGMNDLVPTPVSRKGQPMPNVEVMANIYSALRDDRIVSHANPVFSYLVTFFLITLLLGAYIWWRPSWGFISTLIIAIVPIGISIIFYRVSNIWFAPISATATLFLAFPVWTWLRLKFLEK